MRRGIDVGALSGYAVAGALAAGVAVALGQDPIRTSSWVGLDGLASVGWSLVLGGLLAGATVLASRALSRRTAWARALHEALRPSVRDAGGVTIACMAISSGVGEELLFRGLLVPLVGVVASSVGFGLLHQMRGPSRWVWAAWAGAMGLLFALVFVVTGSLVGAVLAHVAINGANLLYIRDVDPRTLGLGEVSKVAGGRSENTGPTRSLPRPPSTTPRTTPASSTDREGDDAPGPPRATPSRGSPRTAS
jgi:membrane protease YdiL (CAAX protease family)